MKSILHLLRNFAPLKAKSYERAEESQEERSPTGEEATSWTESRLQEIRKMLESDALAMHKFPFPEFMEYHEQHQGVHPNWMTSGLWSFGVAYRAPESQVDPGPAGWYGYAHEFGGSDLPENWVRISSQFGEKVHPSEETIGTEATATSGMHMVGPNADPTAALIAIMKYVNRLYIEKETDFRSAIDSPQDTDPGSTE